MSGFRGRIILIFCMLAAEGLACAQNPPSAPDHPWDTSLAKQQLKVPPRPASTAVLDPAKVYSLSELVNVAEENNPDTRVAWENAKARAADLGIAKSTLYPTLAAEVLASTTREGIFFGNSFQRQTVETFSPVLALDYIIFDFGRRSQEISVSRNALLAANFQFNDTHRRVIFGVMQAYYHLLDTKGLQDAAEANLKNAQTVDQAAEARLQLGLATLPDVLEARSAAAQADYNLQAAIGATEIAHGDLATALGISPTVKFQVESIQTIKMPDNIGDSVETSIDKALAQRPDLLQRVADLRATFAEVKGTQRDFFPTLSVDGNAGMARAYGQQGMMPGVYSPTINPWDAQLTLSWTLFDGLAREKRLEQGSRGPEASRCDGGRGTRSGGEPGVVGVLDSNHGASATEGCSGATGGCHRVLQCGPGIVQLRGAKPDRCGFGATYSGGRAHGGRDRTHSTPNRTWRLCPIKQAIYSMRKHHRKNTRWQALANPGKFRLPAIMACGAAMSWRPRDVRGRRRSTFWDRFSPPGFSVE